MNEAILHEVSVCLKRLTIYLLTRHLERYKILESLYQCQNQNSG